MYVCMHCKGARVQVQWMCMYSARAGGIHAGGTRWSGDKYDLSPDCRVPPRCRPRGRVLTMHGGSRARRTGRDLTVIITIVEIRCGRRARTTVDADSTAMIVRAHEQV